MGQTVLTIEEIMNLQEGDLVMLDAKANTPAGVYVNNKKKFYGNIGTLGVRKAVRINEMILDDENEERTG
jgi:flagellar motor switch protein FliM